jgi:2-desacetyl-2-hydroxyethyl bacteriochlorophyllide A dehydrogenase
MMNSRAVIFEGRHQVNTVAFELGDLKDGEFLVEVAHSVISPGTELRCLDGKQPGATGWGFIPGYACAGHLPDGTAVFSQGTKRGSLPRMWGGHVSHAAVDAVGIYPLPEGLSTIEAPVAKLAAIASRGVLLSAPGQGQPVAVIGLGMIGQLSARLFKQAGADVVAFDTDASRVKIAREAGIDAVKIEAPLREHALSERPELFEIVVEATGVPSVLSDLHQVLSPIPWGDYSGPRRQIVIQASYPETFSIPYQEFFMYEANLLIPRDSRPADTRRCLELMGSGELNVKNLISEVVPASNARIAYQKLLSRESGYTTAAIDWKS